MDANQSAPATAASALERVLRHDRVLVVTALLGIVVLSWLYLVFSAGMDMRAGRMEGMEMQATTPVWAPSHFAAMLLMWIIMMAAMMLPSATPMILLYSTVAGRTRKPGHVFPTTGIFALGYFVIWIAFGLTATSLQWALDVAALLSPEMATTNRVAAAGILIAAGIYQWTPIKQSCLRRCRSPLDFVLSYWREGSWGSLAMGVRHGAFCLGCCWMLMLLLFVGGIMNLLWIAGLSVFVLVEKTAPAGHWAARLAGVALAAWGVFELASLI